MMKKHFNLLNWALCVLCFPMIFSCSDSDDNVAEQVQKELLNKLSYENLLEINTKLIETGLEFQEFNLSKQTDSLIASGVAKDKIFVEVYKITTKYKHTEGYEVNNSGILLLPAKAISSSKDLRLVVTCNASITDKNDAATEVFKNFSQLLKHNFTLFPQNALYAMNGYAVLIPDYPGYGDSFGECVSPFFARKNSANSVIQLTQSAQQVMKKEGFNCKKGINLLGYSLGGFVAGQVGREIETNSAHGLSVNVLVVGPTEIDLIALFDRERKEEQLVVNAINLPWMLTSLKNNGYQNLDLRKIMRTPYDSTTVSYLKGDKSMDDIIAHFSVDPKTYYTEAFTNITKEDELYKEIEQILTDNNLQPWKNKCNLTVIQDNKESVEKINISKNWVEKVNQAGGKATWMEIEGDHYAARLNYYPQAVTIMEQFK